MWACGKRAAPITFLRPTTQRLPHGQDVHYRIHAMYASGAFTLIGDMDQEAYVCAATLLNVDLALRVALCPTVSIWNSRRYYEMIP
jgi:hypothetical protein